MREGGKRGERKEEGREKREEGREKREEGREEWERGEKRDLHADSTDSIERSSMKPMCYRRRV